MSNQHDFYVTRAEEARADAHAAGLDNVRDRCLRAAAAWDAMAARTRRSEVMRAELEARKAAEHEAAALAAASFEPAS
jgi:hypothetical protein